MKKNEADRAEAIAALRKMLRPGATVYTILRHVSRSGMQREISLVMKGRDGLTDLDWYAARAMGWRRGKRGGLVVGGCGMDMGFHLVHNLSTTLYPDGFGCIGDPKPDSPRFRCPSNDHSNGDRNYAKHTKAAPHLHRSGGYALRHSWL